MKIFLILIITATLTACDILEDKLLDCINNDGPELSSNSVPPAILNEVYDVTVGASINNNPHDDSYDYNISFSGDLPAGLSIFRDENDRTIQIIGTPTELGRFQFILSVKVVEKFSGDLEDDDLCYTASEEKYTLVVNMI